MLRLVHEPLLTFTDEVDERHMHKAIRFEARLRANYRRLPLANGRWFALREGQSRVMVTAPHATAAIRHNKMRGPDSGTGWLAHMLHELAGTTILHTTCASPSDPNYYDDNAFKRRLLRRLGAQKPVLVLDLHGSHFSRPFDVDVGTMHGRSLNGRDDLLAGLRQHLRDGGLVQLSENFFPAARNATITRAVARTGVPCMQLEVQSTWLNPARDRIRAHRSARLLSALVKFVRAIDI
jgi:hypothetical protein